MGQETICKMQDITTNHRVGDLLRRLN